MKGGEGGRPNAYFSLQGGRALCVEMGFTWTFPKFEYPLSNFDSFSYFQTSLSLGVEQGL